MPFENNPLTPEIEDEHYSGAHDGEQFKMRWYCQLCDDAIDRAVDMLMSEYE